MDYTHNFKIIIVGDPMVGKSAILERFCNNRFDSTRDITIGIDIGFKIIEVDGMLVRLQLYDTAGHEIYQSITKAYYNNSDGALIVYDVWDDSTKKSIHKWAESIKMSAGDIPIIIVGNKIDANLHEVEITESEDFFTSAKTGENIPDVFQYLTQQIINKKDLKVVKPTDLHTFEQANIFLSEDRKERGKCCG